MEHKDKRHRESRMNKRPDEMGISSSLCPEVLQHRHKQVTTFLNTAAIPRMKSQAFLTKGIAPLHQKANCIPKHNWNPVRNKLPGKLIQQAKLNIPLFLPLGPLTAFLRCLSFSPGGALAWGSLGRMINT